MLTIIRLKVALPHFKLHQSRVNLLTFYIGNYCYLNAPLKHFIILINDHYMCIKFSGPEGDGYISSQRQGKLASWLNGRIHNQCEINTLIPANYQREVSGSSP